MNSILFQLKFLSVYFALKESLTLAYDWPAARVTRFEKKLKQVSDQTVYTSWAASGESWAAPDSYDPRAGRWR